MSTSLIFQNIYLKGDLITKKLLASQKFLHKRVKPSIWAKCSFEKPYKQYTQIVYGNKLEVVVEN